VSRIYSPVLSISKLTHFKQKTLTSVFNVNGAFSQNIIDFVKIFYVCLGLSISEVNIFPYNFMVLAFL